MKNEKKLSLLEDTRGAGFVEYIILVGLIALLCIAAYQGFGEAVSKKVNDQAGKVTNIGNGK